MALHPSAHMTVRSATPGIICRQKIYLIVSILHASPSSPMAQDPIAADVPSHPKPAAAHIKFHMLKSLRHAPFHARAPHGLTCLRVACHQAARQPQEHSSPDMLCAVHVRPAAQCLVSRRKQQHGRTKGALAVSKGPVTACSIGDLTSPSVVYSPLVHAWGCVQHRLFAVKLCRGRHHDRSRSG